jgi:hypothetical protein
LSIQDFFSGGKAARLLCYIAIKLVLTLDIFVFYLAVNLSIFAVAGFMAYEDGGSQVVVSIHYWSAN